MLRFIATSTMGLESVVSSELRKLGYAPKNSDASPGRTFFEGQFKDLVKANLWLRCAGKVLVVMAEFDVLDDFDVIFDAVREIEWENWAPKNASFLVEGRSVRSKITSVPALQRTVKKAIVDRLMRVWKLTSLPEDGPQYTVEISLLKNHAMITLDSTGRGLHRRGYRKMNVVAPLRETIASGLVQLSVWRPERPLLDPFCASGTIPIEAAMIARNIAPGLKRVFDAQGWPVIDEHLWKEAREEAQDLILPPLKEKIHGSDLDAQALQYARQHATLAGVEEDVVFYQRDFADLNDPREYGCIICNPPYGDRLGETQQLRSLYESIPAVLSRLPTWSHFIFTDWLDFESMIGQEATRRRKLYNSRIECVYLQYLGPKPPQTPKNPEVENSTQFVSTLQDRTRSSIDESDDSKFIPSDAIDQNGATADEIPAITPAFAGLDANAQRQIQEFGRCLANRVRHLRRYPSRGVTCYRLYDKDLPEAPFAIDIFEGKWLHIAEYERPDGRNIGAHRLWLDKMVEKAAEVVGVMPEDVFLKRRARQSGHSQYEKLQESGRVVRVHEGGLTFLCNMTDYLDVGLFLDHRLTRKKVQNEAQGKRVLNLFCYSGAFTVYAAAGGASSTVSVDLSPTYLNWCQANLEENNLFDARNRADILRHKFVKSDVLRFLRAIPPATDRNPDIVKLIEETADQVSESKRRAHYARRQDKGESRKKYLKQDRAGKPIKSELPQFPFGIRESNFNLCVCDPPTFSNSKSTEDDWDVQRRHVELLRILATRMTPGGVVYFSNNFRKFKLDEQGLLDLYDIREISNQTVPEEFRNKRIHRCWRLVAK
ncbi:MAG: bifunctional 23S rRNA (guanine(2069)-N(7))-methyltransferase RlmK/23S rRNA (guanine(2445)-N(2))-methyltransferase RlmL [Planctomycetia bacterium]|nr:bifunctional 23S rRNA (guanine(2069)-N(7))-methyltransferase RlmK/23S rRNA (guanine(2445)-N(2))-methyltransferase RlmL [Planctomycetia bacterium]